MSYGGIGGGGGAAADGDYSYWNHPHAAAAAVGPIPPSALGNPSSGRPSSDFSRRGNRSTELPMFGPDHRGMSNLYSAPSSASGLVQGASEKIAVLRDVLHRNQKYQSFLRSQVAQIEDLLGTNSEKRRLVLQIAERQGDVAHTVPQAQRKAIFSAPWFMDTHGNTPPENADTLRKRRLRGTMPAVHRFVKWSDEERRLLLGAVKLQNQKYLLEKALAEHKASVVSSTGPAAKTALLQKHREVTAKITALNPEEFELRATEIDWNAVARVLKTRSAVDCRIQWIGNDDPRINQGEWSKPEDSRLIQLAQEHKQHAWVEVARKLGTNRTAMQCFQRFQRALNSNLVLSKWTPEEDKRLAAEVARHGERNWPLVASKLKRRADTQCLLRWTKSVNPAIRSGRWTPAEDLRLRLAVRAYGRKNWSKIAPHIPGRTDIKCRERWMNVLNPMLTKAEWTPAEDALLLQLTAVAPGRADAGSASPAQPPSWTEIAKAFPGRTDNHVFRRWKRLTESDSSSSSVSGISLPRGSLGRGRGGNIITLLQGRNRGRSKTELTQADFRELTLAGSEREQQQEEEEEEDDEQQREAAANAAAAVQSAQNNLRQQQLNSLQAVAAAAAAAPLVARATIANIAAAQAAAAAAAAAAANAAGVEAFPRFPFGVNPALAALAAAQNTAAAAAAAPTVATAVQPAQVAITPAVATQAPPPRPPAAAAAAAAQPRPPPAPAPELPSHAPLPAATTTVAPIPPPELATHDPHALEPSHHYPSAREHDLSFLPDLPSHSDVGMGHLDPHFEAGFPGGAPLLSHHVSAESLHGGMGLHEDHGGAGADLFHSSSGAHHHDHHTDIFGDLGYEGFAHHAPHAQQDTPRAGATAGGATGAGRKRKEREEQEQLGQQEQQHH